ncbi:MAG: PAS domain S-box protein [Spirosomataceae bacterium]
MSLDRTTYQVLVVEDNPGDFLLIDEFLHEMVWRPSIQRAKNFAEFKHILSNQNDHWDIIFLDLTLPDLSGETLVREVITLANEIPVVVLTGFTDISFAIKSLASGAADYLVKDDLSPTSIYKSLVYNLERKKYVARIRETEKKYQDLFHLSPQPMWIFDLDLLQILDVNSAAISTYGYSREKLLEKKYEEVVFPDDLEVTKELIQSLQKGKQPVKPSIYRHVKADGNSIYVELECQIIDWQMRKACLMLSHDVTERFHRMRAIEEQNKQLKEIARIQSHEVRSPLSGILGLMELLPNLSEEEKQDFADGNSPIWQMMVESAMNLDHLIRQIVDKAQSIDN